MICPIKVPPSSDTLSFSLALTVSSHDVKQTNYMYFNDGLDERDEGADDATKGGDGSYVTSMLSP